MNRLLLSLGLAALLAGCDRATDNTLPEQLPERQVPADAATPIASINTDSPSMPKTSQTPTDLTPQQERDGDSIKSDLDLQATMITPTNQTVIASPNQSPVSNEPKGTQTPEEHNSADTNQAAK